MQYAQAGELTPEQARRMIMNAQNPHPGVSPGIGHENDWVGPLFAEEYAKGYAETTLGLAAGPLGGEGAGAAEAVLARSPAAVNFATGFTLGFEQGFNQGVPTGVRTFARFPGVPASANLGLISGRITGRAASFLGRFDPAAIGGAAAAAADRIRGFFQ